MGIKHHESKKKFWSQFTPEQRTAIMSARVKKGWIKKTSEERLAHSLLMQNARKAKKEKVISVNK